MRLIVSVVFQIETRMAEGERMMICSILSGEILAIESDCSKAASLTVGNKPIDLRLEYDVLGEGKL